MRWQIRQFLAIARLTALEIRQPICLIIMTACTVVIALLPLLVSHTLGEGEKLARDSGLAFHFVCGLVLGSYAACASLTHEIRRGTVSSVLSKPVGRGLFFLAKYTGISVVILAFSAGATVTTLISTRMASQMWTVDAWAAVPLVAAPVLAYALAGLRNFFLRKPFVSGAFVLLLLALGIAFVVAAFIAPDGHRVAFGSVLSWKILPASLLVTLAILVLAGIAVSLAIRLDVVPTLSICTLILFLGLMSDYLFGRLAATSRAAAILYRVVPNWQHFWVTDALSADGIPWSYVALAAAYAGLYLAGILTLGMLAFRQMEVKA